MNTEQNYLAGVNFREFRVKDTYPSVGAGGCTGRHTKGKQCGTEPVDSDERVGWLGSQDGRMQPPHLTVGVFVQESPRCFS